MGEFSDIVYRPPIEAESLVLEISKGCSYGKCIFCQYEADKTPLEILSKEEINRQLMLLSINGFGNPNVFLAGGNVFAFKTKFLVEIISSIKIFLPDVKNIRMYARAEDILNKTKEDLKILKTAGIDILYLGIESGNDEILKILNKNTNRKRMLEALNILDSVGIKYGLSSIIGAGGKEYTKDNAIDTASFYSQVHPDSVRVMMLTVFKNSTLEKIIDEKKFTMLNAREMLEELILLIENINAKDKFLFSAAHVSNLVPILGYLPSDKEKMLEDLKTNIKNFDENSKLKNPEKW